MHIEAQPQAEEPAKVEEDFFADCENEQDNNNGLSSGVFFSGDEAHQTTKQTKVRGFLFLACAYLDSILDSLKIKLLKSPLIPF